MKEYNNVPQLNSENNSYRKTSKIYPFNKRIIDIIGSTIGIIFLFWLFLIIAIIIKMEDPKGPVIFKQKRIGKHGSEFNMYKFRSMVTNAEELLKNLKSESDVTGAMFKMKHDPRVTRIGKFIRKTSIDELPQLWNVLVGNMSLVGPRPPLEKEVMEYSEYDKTRLKVKPGCTGLWQISGRSNIGFKEMVELDLKYINERNTLLDIKIIFRTIKVIFLSEGAY
ncbi:sugar transferase [Pontibacillus salicampi]|uniref:Sugar transferase n=1 Tax=Pontibacillus salicampi TaxID=1449801 RepID=A0ABV6LSE3_9BACI